MALKKSELYSSLWSSFDELRGGMDGNEEIFGKLMGYMDFRKVVSEHLFHKVFMTVKSSDGIRLEKEGMIYGPAKAYRDC